MLLAPWLLPAWWRRVRRVDPRYALLLGWALLVLVFFSASPGKREVYIFPMLPALALAASPLLAGLLRRRGVRAVLWSYLSVVITLTGALGLWLLTASPERVQGLLEGRGMDMSTVKQVSGWLLASDQFVEWIEQPYTSDADLLMALCKAHVSLTASR